MSNNLDFGESKLKNRPLTPIPIWGVYGRYKKCLDHGWRPYDHRWYKGHRFFQKSIGAYNSSVISSLNGFAMIHHGWTHTLGKWSHTPRDHFTYLPDFNILFLIIKRCGIAPLGLLTLVFLWGRRHGRSHSIPKCFPIVGQVHFPLDGSSQHPALKEGLWR